VVSSRTMDPPFVGRFVFTVDGLTIGAFTEVSGLSVQIDVEELPEGGQNQFVHKLPGRMKWPNLVLKRGITNSDNLFEWFQRSSGDGFAGAGNALERRNGAISLADAKGRMVRTWRFTQAYPVKWTGPRFSASSRDLAVEELEVCHHGFRSGT
jgi:phage tail-like protein